jgi:uncharacterized Tic20 family protein
MTTTPPDEPQQPSAPTPPPPSGFEAVPPPPPYTPPAYSAPPAPAYGAPAGLTDSDQRTWAMLAHLSGFLSIIATVVIWAVYKDRGQYIREQATEALNFQILGTVAGIAISIIAAITLGFGAILFIVLLAWPILMIMAAIASNRGEAYRYPFNWRIIK